MPRGQQAGRSRANVRAPRVPKPPKTPRYDVKGIQSIGQQSRQRTGAEIRLDALLNAPRRPQRRELTAQEMGSLYPQLVSKRPELLNRLAKRGVTYYTDPLLERDVGAAGTYSPSSREVTVQLGQSIGVAGHEITHAALSTGPINPVRFLTDRRYRAARSADLIIGGGLVGTALALYLAAGSRPDPTGFRSALRVSGAGYQSEVFAMGAGGAEGYMDLPVDYSLANQLFGGTFDPFALRTFGGREIFGTPERVLGR